MKKNGFTDFVKLAGVVAAGVTPVLYIIGYYYEIGWLSAFGLGSSVIDKSVQTQLLNFYEFLLNVLPYADKTWLLIMVLFISWVFFTLAFYFLVIAAKWLSAKIKKYTDGISFKLFSDRKELASSALINAFYFFTPLFLFGVTILVALPAKIAYDSGVKGGVDAKSNIKNCIDKRNHVWEACVNLTINKNKDLIGYVVLNNDNYIALYSDNGTTLISKNKEFSMIRRQRKGD